MQYMYMVLSFQEQFTLKIIRRLILIFLALNPVNWFKPFYGSIKNYNNCLNTE